MGRKSRTRSTRQKEKTNTISSLQVDNKVQDDVEKTEIRILMEEFGFSDEWEKTDIRKLIYKSDYSIDDVKMIVIVLLVHFRHNRDAVMELNRHSHNRGIPVPEPYREDLINHGLLKPTGDMSRVVNAALVMLRTGDIPFWMKKDYIN